MSVLEGFQALGTETWLAVGNKQTDHPRVVMLPLPADLDAGCEAGALSRAALRGRRSLERRLGLEDFNFPSTRRLLSLTGSPPDVVLLHNLHGGFFDLRQLGALSRRVPVVLALADSWLFTGHCACPLGCDRWQRGCGACPDLAIPPAVSRDATALNWRRKRRILAGARFVVVTPSRWLLERARRSILAPAVVDAHVIAHGVDLDVFSPGPAAPGRRRLGIDDSAPLLLYVATDGAANAYKDFATIRAAVARLARETPGSPLELVVVGGAADDEVLGEGVRVRHLTRLDSRRDLAELYRAADVYVHAAREESFGLTAAEALACGIPVVAAVGGGLPEVVEHGRTGLIVAPGDEAGLAAALRGVLGDRAERTRMGRAAADAARTRFGERRMLADLHACCVQAAAGGPAARAAYAAAGVKP
jgi:glycosyltransferase involved in cell wall biosynthesis